MRKKLTMFANSTAAFLAIATGIADLLGKSDVLCDTSACVKVHFSSFGAIFSIPIGFYAAALLLLSLWFYAKGRESLSLTVLCGLLGVEAYLTFLQIFFIGSLCTICLLFFWLLFTCAILAQVKKDKTAMLTGVMVFFMAHFVFFFPNVTLKPTLIRDVPEDKSVEIFASPSCSHCEAALKALRKVCTATGTPLIVRPVAISRKDREKSVKWVSGKLFQCGSPITYRLAEKIVWENEDVARRLNNGKLAVPVILVRVDGIHEIFRGWSKEVKDSVEGILEATGGSAIGTAEASDDRNPGIIAGEDQSSPEGFAPIKEMCTGTPECND